MVKLITSILESFLTLVSPSKNLESQVQKLQGRETSDRHDLLGDDRIFSYLDLIWAALINVTSHIFSWSPDPKVGWATEAGRGFLGEMDGPLFGASLRDLLKW